MRSAPPLQRRWMAGGPLVQRKTAEELARIIADQLYGVACKQSLRPPNLWPRSEPRACPCRSSLSRSCCLHQSVTFTLVPVAGRCRGGRRSPFSRLSAHRSARSSRLRGRYLWGDGCDKLAQEYAEYDRRQQLRRRSLRQRRCSGTGLQRSKRAGAALRPGSVVDLPRLYRWPIEADALTITMPGYRGSCRVPAARRPPVAARRLDRVPRPAPDHH